MNQEIYNKPITDNKKITKNHQAYAMEASRLKFAKQDCLNNNNCEVFEELGGEGRLLEIEPMVQGARTVNKLQKKTRDPVSGENQYNKKDSETSVSVPKVTKSSEHVNSVDKILTNNQALNEEISTIKYLIEYMNNNKKQNL